MMLWSQIGRWFSNGTVYTETDRFVFQLELMRYVYIYTYKGVKEINDEMDFSG